MPQHMAGGMEEQLATAAKVLSLPYLIGRRRVGGLLDAQAAGVKPEHD